MSWPRSPRRSRGWVAAPADITSASPEATEAAGERLGRALGPGAVVALTGELGAGKTCFIQGLVRGLGATVRATSPTFVLVNQYTGRVPVYHVDAYRTGSMTELMDMGLLEMLGGTGGKNDEWVEKNEAMYPRATFHVTL